MLRIARSIRAVAIAAFLGLALLAAHARADTTGGSRIQFVADSETGDFTQWGCPHEGWDGWPSCQIYDATYGTGGRGVATGPRRVVIDALHARQGTYSTRFEVRTGDGAYVLSGGDPGNDFSLVNWYADDEGEPLGKTVYWGFSVRFDETWPPYFGFAFADWHQKRGGCAGPAPLNLDAGAGFRLVVRGGSCGRWLQSSFSFDERGFRGMTQRWNGGNQAPPGGRFERGRWYDLIVGVRWSSSRAGWVEVWLARTGRKLRRVVPRTHVPTAFSDGGGIYLKTGIYRQRTIVPAGIMWQDAWRRGSSFARVAATRGCCAH